MRRLGKPGHSLGHYAGSVEVLSRHPRRNPRTRRAEFDYDGGGLAKGGNVTLYYDGEKVGEGRVEMTQPMVFSADEGLDIGRETGTAVAPECDVQSSAFTGEIEWVELKVGDDDHGHLVDPEDLIHVLIVATVGGERSRREG